MSTRVDFYTGAAWSAMPSVATRPISVVDLCCRHTLHVSWQPAVVPSAPICLPLRKVCLLLLVDVLLCARKWGVKERGDHLRKAGGGQKMKGWKEGGQRTKEGERVLRQRKPRGWDKQCSPPTIVRCDTRDHHAARVSTNCARHAKQRERPLPTTLHSLPGSSAVGRHAVQNKYRPSPPP